MKVRACRQPAQRPPTGSYVQTLDDMRALHLLTDEQHAGIGAWIARARTPEAILEMPPELWRIFALASVLMGVDADLAQPPMTRGSAG